MKAKKTNKHKGAMWIDCKGEYTDYCDKCGYVREEKKLVQEVEERLLSFADEQEELTRSDFQGRAYVVALEIIKLVENNS